MRLLIVLLAGVTGLAAQVTAPDAAAAKLKQFERNLANAMRPHGGPVSVTFPRPPGRVCAIPLLRVRPDASFKSNMPLIAPDPKIKFSARELIPPGPVCDEQTRK
jgi:hypothetical protein